MTGALAQRGLQAAGLLRSSPRPSCLEGSHGGLWGPRGSVTSQTCLFSLPVGRLLPPSQGLSEQDTAHRGRARGLDARSPPSRVLTTQAGYTVLQRLSLIGLRGPHSCSRHGGSREPHGVHSSALLSAACGFPSSTLSPGLRGKPSVPWFILAWPRPGRGMFGVRPQPASQPSADEAARDECLVWIYLLVSSFPCF